MLWLCLRFPQLPLAVFGAHRGEAPGAVLESGRILQANDVATAAGIGPGQSRALARNLCPSLQLLSRDNAREQRRLQQLALWAYRFTPELSLTPPDALLLEISGSLRLFRGFGRLHRGLVRGLARRGMAPASGLAHTPEAALLLSHHPGDCGALIRGGQLDRRAVSAALEQLPLTVLPCQEETLATLRAMGLQRLGEVLALPRAALTRRLGADFGHWLARLTGEQPDPRPHYTPPPEFTGERQFNGELTEAGQLRFPMSALLRDLQQYLQLRQCVARQLQWHFQYSDGRQEVLNMPFSRELFHYREVLALTLLRLEGWRLPAPVDSLTLHCEQFEALQATSGELFTTPGHSVAEQDQRYQGVMERLQARLGEGCGYHPLPRDEHLPEQAWQRGAPLDRNPPPPTDFPLRPLWLLPRPQQLSPRRGRLYWQGRELELLQGPERIDSDWWHERQARDYYTARRDDGGVYWLYRDCLNGRWFVHGVFA